MVSNEILRHEYPPGVRLVCVCVCGLGPSLGPQLALQDIPELPNLGLGGGRHLVVVKTALQLKDRLEQEKRCVELLTSAIAERDLASLQVRAMCVCV